MHHTHVRLGYHLNVISNLGAALSMALAIYVALFSAYMACIVVGAWLSRLVARGTPVAAGQPAVVVLVPAHNEEQGIASTVSQILQADYASGQIRVVVIADNCTDGTATVARQAGAQVVERTDLVNRGKGQALGWALREHRVLFAGSGLLAIIDADMNVEAGFFAAMSQLFRLESIQVAQGRYVISNPARGVLSAIGFASYCYVNHVRPAGRCFWGGTADLKGSGMMFRTGFLLERGWNAHSIAEDIQLGKELMLEGVSVSFAQDAIVRSDIPATLAQVRVQQARWEGGKHHVIASVFPRTLTALCRRPSLLLLDGLLDMLVPSLAVVVLLDLCGLALGWWAIPATAPVFAGSLAVFATAVLTGLLLNRAPAGVYLRLLSAPIFLLWKLLLLARLAIRPPEATWNRTPRDPPPPP